MLVNIPDLEKPDNAACFGVQANLPEARTRSQTGHGLHVTQNWIQKPSTRRQADRANGKGES